MDRIGGAQVGKRGKYDRVADSVRKDLRARAVVLLVIDGRDGSGMSASERQSGNEPPLTMQRHWLAEQLRAMATILEGEEPAISGVGLHFESDEGPVS